MKWPWVSRLAFELLERELQARDREIERLNGRIDDLLDHRKRLQRVEKGIREEPRGAKAEREQVPDEIRRLIMSFDSEAVQRQLENDVRRAREERKLTWSEIYDRMVDQIADGMQ